MDLILSRVDTQVLSGQIQYYCTLHNLSSPQLAKAMGVARSVVYNLLHDKAPLTVNMARRLGVVFSVDPTIFYDDYLHFISSDYGEIILRAIARLQLKPSQFARLAGVDEGELSRWVRRLNQPDRNSYNKLLPYLF